MKFALPLVFLLVGFRIAINPVIRSAKFGFVFDLTGYNHLVGGAFIVIGAILLFEAAGMKFKK